ncbi:MAG: glycosyltransferase family 2 protein, partial [Lentisphaeria bacterium]|nr:glycosyltransferase family 2 protein [Lentisphaeria bacterium]
MDIKVSVCIPVYGVEKYIERCARSLFEQTMRDGIEFIFVNDCTPDKSIEILEQILSEYPHRQEQTKIIHHKQNGGLVAARNTGLAHASGEY